MSDLEALNGFRIELHLVYIIIKDYIQLTDSGKIIVMCWIPSHVNIRGNDRTDTAAKSALSFPSPSMKIPADKLIPSIFEFCMTEWQNIWDCCEDNKLHSL